MNNILNMFKYRTNKREPFYDVLKPLLKKNCEILDVGSGDGSFSKYFNMNDIIGVDTNPINDNLKWDSPEPLPFDNNVFDVVHSSHLVEHLYPNDLYLLIVEMNRVLKPSGYICISAPLFSSKFYNDLSHIKPYNPPVFINYLCSPTYDNRTRNLIGGYKLINLIYRYTPRLLPVFKKDGYTIIFYKMEV